MPRIDRGEILEFDPDIERTFRQRRRAQRESLSQNPPEMALPPPNQPPPFGPQGRPIFENPPDNRFQDLFHHEDDDRDDETESVNHEEPRVQPPNIINLANSKDGRIMDYAIPDFEQLNSGISRPHFTTTHFEPKPIMFHMLQTNGQFAGIPTEDPHSHLRSFLEVCNSFLIPGVSSDALRLTLFPFSLRDRARDWLNSLTPGSVTSWNDMAEIFLRKYFPPTRNAKSRNEICLFKQTDDEAIPDAWERFKELLRKCPHHGIPYCIQLETFYNGLNATARQMLDATAGGAFTASTYNEGFTMLERISENNGLWVDPRASSQKKTAGIHDIDAYTALQAQLLPWLICLKASLQAKEHSRLYPHLLKQSSQCNVFVVEGNILMNTVLKILNQ